ncbi:MAG TPA: DUF3710 domain-containing protein [Pseudonocardiaceae bacterium]|nr:DUF3710 domain-containing protein [Pseudonocardiaceae bacterium]
MAIFGQDRAGREPAGDDDYVDDYQVDRADDGYYDESGDEYDGDGPIAGPYDEDEVPDDGLARLDLGSVRLPLPADAQVQVEMDPAGALHAVHVLTPNGRFTVSAYAAPKSGDLWPEVSRELADQLHGDGARVRREYGEWGAELVAFVNDVLLRFVGVDGPRWMLRAVSAGPKETSAKAAEELRDIVRGAVVVRGPQPMPVRTPLPLTLPDEITQHIEQAQTGQA